MQDLQASLTAFMLRETKSPYCPLLATFNPEGQGLTVVKDVNAKETLIHSNNYADQPGYQAQSLLEAFAVWLHFQMWGFKMTRDKTDQVLSHLHSNSTGASVNSNSKSDVWEVLTYFTVALSTKDQMMCNERCCTFKHTNAPPLCILVCKFTSFSYQF